MKYTKIVIKYVLRSIGALEITNMQMTLEILLKLMDKLPDYYAADVLEALLGEEKEEEVAEDAE